MAKDREQELQRLEEELLKSIETDDDLLADIPIELLDTAPITWDDTPSQPKDDEFYISPEELEDYPETPIVKDASMENTKKKSTKKVKDAKKREDRWQITLMAIASFLCVGIIGVLIYWLEAFLT